MQVVEHLHDHFWRMILSDNRKLLQELPWEELDIKVQYEWCCVMIPHMVIRHMKWNIHIIFHHANAESILRIVAHNVETVMCPKWPKWFDVTVYSYSFAACHLLHPLFSAIYILLHEIPCMQFTINFLYICHVDKHALLCSLLKLSAWWKEILWLINYALYMERINI